MQAPRDSPERARHTGREAPRAIHVRSLTVTAKEEESYHVRSDQDRSARRVWLVRDLSGPVAGRVALWRSHGRVSGSRGGAGDESPMKVQEVILRTMSGEFAWVQAAEILGLSPRSMRRWRARYEEHGYDGLYDRRTRRPSPQRVPVGPWSQCCGCTGAVCRLQRAALPRSAPAGAWDRIELFFNTLAGVAGMRADNLGRPVP